MRKVYYNLVMCPFITIAAANKCYHHYLSYNYWCTKYCCLNRNRKKKITAYHLFHMNKLTRSHLLLIFKCSFDLLCITIRIFNVRGWCFQRFMMTRTWLLWTIMVVMYWVVWYTYIIKYWNSTARWEVIPSKEGWSSWSMLENSYIISHEYNWFPPFSHTVNCFSHRFIHFIQLVILIHI